MPEVVVIEATNVSLFWKISHILQFTIAGLSGIVSGFVQNVARQLFDEKCFLGGQPKLITSSGDETDNKTNGKIIIDVSASLWSSQSRCDFPQYTMICSFIFAVIWSVFFIMCEPGGRSKSGLPQPWRIVPPALIFSLIMVIAVAIATTNYTNACDEFCQIFDREFATLTNLTASSPCLHVNDVLNFERNESFAVLIKVAKISAWISVAFWISSLAFFVLRIAFAPDFVIIYDAKQKGRKKSLHNA